MPDPADSVAVVVPTRDRPAGLRRCLTALAAQRQAAEVVVVDDGSRDPRATETALSALPEAKLVRSERSRGPAAARNIGAEACAAEVICFTDDDCEPGPEWAALLARAARASGGGAAAGRTVAPDEAGAAVLASQAVIDELQLGSLATRDGEATLGFAPTCNLALTRKLLGAQRFDEGFPLAAGEDREFTARLRACGRAPVYVPEALVVHRQAEGVAALLRRQYRYGRGGVHFRDRSSGGSAPAPAWIQRRLLQRCLDLGPGVAAAAAVGQLATAAGAARERLAGSGPAGK